jgi:Raf kinase inhibitor-like YbhB/YbcL family protein
MVWVAESRMPRNLRGYGRPEVLGLVLVVFVGILAAMVDKAKAAEPVVKDKAFTISSSSFSAGGEIPKKFSCDDTDVSPELSWTGAPAGVRSFAMIADDPDAPAGTWIHWVLFDLPPQTAELLEGVPKVDEVPTGGRQGRNDFGKIGYNGPCPPPGKPHRYFFKLYALDQMLNLKAGVSKKEVEQAMQGHILGTAELTGKYRR